MKTIPGPYAPEEMAHFLNTFLYDDGAFFVDAVSTLDAEAKRIEAVLETTGPLPFAAMQRTDQNHPAHVAAAEMLMATGSLGCLHAWFFHGCRWDEGWAGFGSRIHRADFKALAPLGPPMQLISKEVRARVGARRIMLRLEFEFFQEGKLIYRGDQSALFVKEHQGFQGLAPKG